MQVYSVNLQAINNAATMQEVSANNIANMNSTGFQSSRALQIGDTVQISPEARAAQQNAAGEMLSTTDVGQEMVNMRVNKHSLQANVAAIRTQDEMQEALMGMIK